MARSFWVITVSLLVVGDFLHGKVSADDVPIRNETLECPDNETYTDCLAGDTCEDWCDGEHPKFCSDCLRGCICKEGYIRIAKGGECIPKEYCPKKDLENSHTSEKGIHKQEETDEKCQENEVFSICRGYTWCQASCKSLHRPYECPDFCIKGCKCKEGYVRYTKGGACIPEKDCSTGLTDPYSIYHGLDYMY